MKNGDKNKSVVFIYIYIYIYIYIHFVCLLTDKKTVQSIILMVGLF